VGGAVYVLGGFEKINGEDLTVGSIFKIDSRLQTWSEMAPMPAERYFAGVCVVGSRIYVFGGCNDNEEVTSTTYRFSTESYTWATLAPMPEDKCRHSVCVLVANNMYRFDTAANSWSEMAPMSVAQMGFGAFVLGGSIHAVGGWVGRDPLTSMERYCVASDSWSEVGGADLNTARGSSGTQAMRFKVELSDSLIAKAKLASR
jgi:hypothetical protein